MTATGNKVFWVWIWNCSSNMLRLRGGGVGEGEGVSMTLTLHAPPSPLPTQTWELRMRFQPHLAAHAWFRRIFTTSSCRTDCSSNPEQATDPQALRYQCHWLLLKPWTINTDPQALRYQCHWLLLKPWTGNTDLQALRYQCHWQPLKPWTGNTDPQAHHYQSWLLLRPWPGKTNKARHWIFVSRATSTASQTLNGQNRHSKDVTQTQPWRPDDSVYGLADKNAESEDDTRVQTDPCRNDNGTTKEYSSTALTTDSQTTGVNHSIVDAYEMCDVSRRHKGCWED